MIEASLATFYRLFGYASLVGLFLVGTATLTASVLLRAWDRHTSRVLSTVRPEIVSRINADEPEWEAWVAGLSRLDRRIVRTEVYRQLRTVSGDYARELADLAVALGIDDQARGQLVASDSRDKLRGLARLAVLDTSVDPEWLADAAATPRERATVGRVLASNPEFVGPASVATYLLEPGETLPSDAVYSLYRVMSRRATAIRLVTDEWRSWDDTLVAQVLSVLRHTHDGSDALTAWICTCLEADAATVRMAAVNALEPVIDGTGQVPDAVDVDSVMRDDSVRVRAAAFEQFAGTSEETTARLVEAALVEPSNVACLVAALNLEAELRDRTIPAEGPLANCLDWAASTDNSWSMDWQTPWQLDWERQPVPTRELSGEPPVGPEPTPVEVTA